MLELLRLSTITTLKFWFNSSTAICEPINPVPPVTKIVVAMVVAKQKRFKLAKASLAVQTNRSRWHQRTLLVGANFGTANRTTEKISSSTYLD